MTARQSKRARRARKATPPSSSSAAPPKPAQLGVTAYAHHRGVRLGAVQHAIADGRLRDSVTVTPTGRRMLDVARADEEWERLTDPAQSERASAPTREKARLRSTEQAPDESPESEGVDPDLLADYHRERAKRERYNAHLAKLEVFRLKGQLIDAQEVESRQAEVSRRVRAALLSLPNRLGPVLAAEADAAAVSRMLEAELNQVLQALARELRSHAQAATG